jgi:hypothetical protein
MMSRYCIPAKDCRLDIKVAKTTADCVKRLPMPACKGEAGSAADES